MLRIFAAKTIPNVKKALEIQVHVGPCLDPDAALTGFSIDNCVDALLLD